MQNRVYKFRAWDKECKEMCIVNDLTFIFESEDGIMASVIDSGASEPHEYKRMVMPEQLELMQFTGLLDKNGLEIWEGDLLRVQSQYETDEPIDSAPNEVYFRDGAFRCGFHDMILGEKVCTGSEGNWNVEVIGNIWEDQKVAETLDTKE